MKTVVIVGADFSPSSLPPALRIRFLARHLPEFGWRPVVLTTEPRYYETSVDPENERLLPDGLEVIRTRAFSARSTRKLGVGDVGIRSLWHHWRALSRLCRTRAVDLVYIPVPPYAAMVLGRLAHERFGVPYVIDYIDPWIDASHRAWPRTRWPPKWLLAQALARVLEPVSLKKAAHLTGVSKGTTDGVIERYPWLTTADAAEIPYGGETADFEYLSAHPRPNRIFNPADGSFHLSYVGACPASMRSTVRAVFAAAGAGLGREPELFRRLRLHFVGTSYAPGADHRDSLRAVAEECGVAGIFDEHPARVSYLDALQLVLDSDALLLLGSDAPHYTASKVFPYLLSKKPLLAVFHEASTVVGILREAGAANVVTYGGPSPPAEKVERILALLIDTLRGGGRPSLRSSLMSERYSARAMAAKLARVFEEGLAEPEQGSASAAAILSAGCDGRG